MSVRRNEAKVIVRTRVSWEEVMSLLWVLDSVDHADYDIRDAETLERWAAWIRKVVADRSPQG